ncbi:MAG: sel1 repeat family protein [Geminicoccaceae bacterium]|nr:MAG: sel1 repeat family protein [Geminicoccaceae bacterium]
MPDQHLSQDIDYLKEAADNGNAEAMFLLGVCHAEGKKVDQNYREAAKWFHGASKKGHVRATVSLGFLYSKGRGVRLDQKLAYKLWKEAQQKGDPLASDLVSMLRQQMSPQMLKEAEKLAASGTIT